jgi:eukaryotic-like serine/threonine-protein kinase
MSWNLKRFNRNTLGGVLIHLLLAVLTVLTLGILYFYAYLPYITNHGETITVPNVEGKSIEEAQDYLARHDLRCEVSDSLYSAEAPPLAILKQYPHAGAKVKENRKIYLSVNRVEPPTVPLPNLIDGSVINADALLKANELKLGRIEYVEGPFNIVKDMKYKGKRIAANTRVPKGAVIDLVVMSGGPREFAVPDVVGLSLEDAKVPLFGYYLSIGRIVAVGDTTGGTAVVIMQKPADGKVRVGDVVDLWVGQPGTTPPDEEL